MLLGDGTGKKDFYTPSRQHTPPLNLGDAVKPKKKLKAKAKAKSKPRKSMDVEYDDLMEDVEKYKETGTQKYDG